MFIKQESSSHGITWPQAESGQNTVKQYDMQIPNKHTCTVLGRPYRHPELMANHISHAKQVNHVNQVSWCILEYTANLVGLNPRRAEMRTTQTTQGQIESQYHGPRGSQNRCTLKGLYKDS